MKLTLLFFLLPFCLAAQQLPVPIGLPNGWQLSPAGSSKPLGDLPLNMIISGNGKYMAVVNCGQSVQTIQLFELPAFKQLDAVVIPKTWYGLAFSNDGQRLYASGGNDNIIWQYSTTGNKLALTDSIILGNRWPKKISPAGMAIDDAANTLYVVTKESNQLLCIDLVKKEVSGKFDLGGEGYTCVLSPGKKELYASCWGCDKVKYLILLQNNLSQIYPWVTIRMNYY